MPVTRTRLSPAARREQLLDLGVQLVSEGTLDDLSIDGIAERAGISRGLLYHYFAGQREFRLAVLQRLADQVIAATAPREDDPPLEQLVSGLRAYVDFVAENRAAYVAFVRAASGGDEDFRTIYDHARSALTDRIFTTADPAELASLGLRDTPATRLLVHGWSALVEEMLLTWLADPRGIGRKELVDTMAAALYALGAIVSPTR